MADIRHHYSQSCATGANGCTASPSNARIHVSIPLVLSPFVRRAMAAELPAKETYR